jgi:hypothetical protein
MKNKQDFFGKGVISMKEFISTICVGIVLLLLILVFLCCSSDSEDIDDYEMGSKDAERTFKGNRPPIPNFRKQIDYFAWANEYYAQNKTLGSSRIYEGFWQYHADEECMPDPNKDVEEQLLRLTRGPTWESGQYPQVKSYMENIAGYIKLFEQAANEPEYCLQLKRDTDIPNFTGILPWSLSGEYAVSILLAQSWQVGKDQPERMYQAWQTGLKHSTHLGRSRELLMVMRSSFIRLMIYQSVRDAVAHNVIYNYKEALDVLTKADPGPFNLTESLYCNWGAALGLLQELYPRTRLNKTLASLIGGLDINELRRAKVKPIALIPHIDIYFVKLLHASEQPLSAELLQEVRDIHSEINKSPFSSHPLRNFIFPKLDKPFLLELRRLTSFRATAIILLLHQYYSKHTVWPKSLSLLELDDQSEYLVDPFSGQPFVYIPSSESFLLYSVSEDKTDNGGKHKTWNRWGETERDTDFVFWPSQQ